MGWFSDLFTSGCCQLCGHVNDRPITVRACANCGYLYPTMRVAKGRKLVLAIAGGILFGLALAGWGAWKGADCDEDPDCKRYTARIPIVRFR